MSFHLLTLSHVSQIGLACTVLLSAAFMVFSTLELSNQSFYLQRWNHCFFSRCDLSANSEIRPPTFFFFLFFVWDFSSCSFQQGDIKVNVECSCNWSAQQRKRAVPNCFQIYLNSDPSLQLQFLDQSQGEFGSFHLIRAFSFPSVWGLAMACKPSRRGTLILQHPAPVRPRVRGRKWAAVVLDKKTDNDKQGGF